MLRVSRDDLTLERFQLRCLQIAGEWSNGTFFAVVLDIQATFHEMRGHYAVFVAIAKVPAYFDFDTIASVRLFRSEECAEGFNPTHLFSQLFVTQDSCMCDAHMTFRRVLAFNIHRCSTHCYCINGRCPNTFITSSAVTFVRDCGTVVFKSDQHDNLGVCVLPYPLGAHNRHQCTLFLQAYVLADESSSEEESDDEQANTDGEDDDETSNPMKKMRHG